MRRTVPLVCVCLFLLTAAESALAQQRLLVRMGSEIVEFDSRLPSFGTVIRRAQLPDVLGLGTSHVVTFGGGQSLAWAAHGALLALDTFSGAVGRFTLPGFVLFDVVGTDGNARLIILGAGQDSHTAAFVVDARSGRVHVVDLGPGSSVGPVAYAVESDALFVARWKERSIFDRVDVFQVASGALVKTLDISAAYVDNPSPWGSFMSVNTAGTRLFVNVVGGGTFAFDVLSGTPSASSRTLDSVLAQFDDLRNRFVVGGAGSIAAFSAESLSPLGSARVPMLPQPPPAETSGTIRLNDLDVSGLSATIFVLESLFTRFAQHTVCESQLHALHADTGQVRRTVKMTNTLGDGACDEQPELIRITEPAPPPTPTANVSGRQVILNWRAPFGATHYEVEAGSAPGLANITTINVSDPKLVIDGVPSGTYYVRVRAINTIGKSGASQEVQVIVGTP